MSRVSIRLEHRGRDGATVEGLPFQTQGLQVQVCIHPGRFISTLSDGVVSATQWYDFLQRYN